MATLNTYLQQCQRLLRDQKQEVFNIDDLREYVNRARRQVALDTQCLRILPPISTGISTIEVTAGGTGYTNPTVVISAPDSPAGGAQFAGGAQATGTATVNLGIITDIQVDYGGAGYFQPAVTITDPTGTGATAIANVVGILETQQNQEIYNFADVDLSMFPGVASIIGVRGVSIIYANYRYSLPQYAFSTYQAKIRQYPRQYYYVPTMCSQFGQGASGSLYCYPIASTNYQMEWDCVALPSDLTDDLSAEALPAPWTDPIPFLACYYALAEIQNLNFARWYKGEYDDWMKRASAAARPSRAVNPYGRYAWIVAAIGMAALLLPGIA